MVVALRPIVVFWLDVAHQLPFVSRSDRLSQGEANVEGCIAARSYVSFSAKQLNAKRCAVTRAVGGKIDAYHGLE